MDAHSKNLDELLKELETDKNVGLTDSEVVAKREKYGENKLSTKKKKSTFVRFLEQFKDVMIIILIIAAIISFVVACLGDDPMEFIEPALIVFIVLLNAVIGVLQESKAEKAL